MINAEDHIGLVYNIVKKFNITFVEYEDLVGFGMLGLVKAAKRFDETKGFKFSTYAVPMIYWEIRESIRDKSGILGTRYMKENGQYIIPSYIEDFKTEDDDGNKVSFEILKEEDFSERVAEYLDLGKALLYLKPRDKRVIEEFYYKDRSQKDIGNELGLTEKYVRCIVARSKGVIRPLIKTYIGKVS